MTENVMQFRPKQTVNAILANLLSMKTGWKQPLRKREIKMSRIQQTFAALDGAKALIPYITVGDPNLDTTLALMHSLVENGADILELGVPFSDPMADGPTIQRAAERALANKVSLNDVLNIVRRFRETNGNTPVVLMGYLNPIHKIGYQAFAQAAAEAGVDGVLTVDSPVETITPLHDALKARGIDCIFLIAPTTTEERIQTIARVAAIHNIKQSGNLIPLHLPGRIIGVQVDFDINVELACLKATLTVQAHSNGSIATEALTGLNLALLSVYDMMKDVDRNMMLSGIRLESETSSEGRPFLFDNAYENINF